MRKQSIINAITWLFVVLLSVAFWYGALRALDLSATLGY
jgi:hypothetical protein